ncbi:MAG TPA: PAS domain S-box protein, partial [Azospirillaceae bacterium]|nr:PAS domain S-box protein [Azospirillaceae bacterium]
GAQRFKGYTRDEILGRHFSCFFTEPDRQSGLPKRALATALAEGKFETEGWRVRKDGTRFWAHVVLDPIRDEAGTLVGFAKVTRDITERKRAQEALRLSEERFRLLVQGVTDYAIYMLDPDGTVTNWNSGAQRLKGYTEEEIVGRHFSTFYTEEDRAAGIPDRGLRTARREGRFETEGWRIRKDGTRFFASVVIDPIHDEMGELVGFAKITRDITERRSAQEALEQARAALFQSQKMEAIGRLTGGVAHDFNNLLTVIVNSLDLLSRKVQDPRDMRLVENAHRAAERGAKLTQQLLAFARRQPLRPERHSITALVGGFEAILRRACGETVDLRIDLAPRLAMVSIDAPQFEAALLNLVVNARDAMPSGGHLRIGTDTVEFDLPRARAMGLEPGSYVVVSVEDTGAGIPPELLNRVMEPFFTTKEIGKGTGLGLSQVYGFVTQSKGQVEIDSTVGVGTTIRLYLPLVEGEPASTGTGGSAAEREQYGTVLIVEDEADVLETAVELFRSLGYAVLTATDGAKALTVLDRHPKVDVLFTDVVMPGGLSGVDLAREARRRRPGLQVLLASGYPQPAVTAEHGDLSDFSFLAKPYRWTELADRLKALRHAGREGAMA